MDELTLQSMIIEAANDAGGRAHKMNNRFLIGVSDLLVKLPKWPAGFLEVKQRDWPSSDGRFLLDVTHPQQKFLRQFNAAGMPCGVASFLQTGTGSGLSLWLNISTWETIAYSDSTIKPFTLTRQGHTFLGKADQRPHHILILLQTFFAEWDEQQK